MDRSSLSFITRRIVSVKKIPGIPPVLYGLKPSRNLYIYLSATSAGSGNSWVLLNLLWMNPSVIQTYLAFIHLRFNGPSHLLLFSGYTRTYFPGLKSDCVAGGNFAFSAALILSSAVMRSISFVAVRITSILFYWSWWSPVLSGHVWTVPNTSIYGTNLSGPIVPLKDFTVYWMIISGYIEGYLARAMFNTLLREIW